MKKNECLRSIIISVFVFLIATFFTGCKKNFEDLAAEDWKPILAIPLVYAELSVDDILTEFNHPEEVLIFPDGLIALNYKGELLSFNPTNILSVEDQDFEEVLEIDETTATILDSSSEPVQFSVNVEIPLNLLPTDIKVTEISIAEGMLDIGLARLQDEGVSGELMINELVDQNEQPLVIVFNGDFPVGEPEQVNFNLAGYSLIPTFTPPFSHEITISGTLNLSNNPSNVVTQGDFLELGFHLNDLVFEYIIGDFGNISLSQDTDTVNLNLFNNIQSGSFALSDAIINLGVTNSFGLPFEIELGNVVSINQNSGTTTQLFLSNINLEGQQELNGPAEEEEFTFNNQNANLSSLFVPAPVDVIFDIEATANPDGPPPPGNLNFITNQSNFVVDIDIILPLEGYALDLLLTDSIEVDLSFDQYDEIDSLQFKLQSENTFPLAVDFQAYFLDVNSQLLDSLFLNDTLIIPPAITNSNGDVIASASETTIITFENIRAENLEQTERVFLKAIFNTSGSSDQENIKIKQDQELIIQLGLKIFGNLEI